MLNGVMTRHSAVMREAQTKCVDGVHAIIGGDFVSVTIVNR